MQTVKVVTQGLSFNGSPFLDSETVSGGGGLCQGMKLLEIGAALWENGRENCSGNL